MGNGLAQIAWRNLWRHRRRTLLTLSSVAFAVMLATLFTGLGDATYGEMIDLAARMGVGHVAIQHPEYLDTPTLSRTVDGAAGLRAVALEDPDVRRVVKRITGSVMIASASKSTGAAFIAFDPALEDTTTLSLLDALVEGEFQGPGDRPGVVLGVDLAESLGGGVGRKVVLTLTDRSGEIVQEAVRITGLLRTGAPTADGRLVLMPISLLEGTLGYADDETGQVAIFLEDQRRSDAVAARLATRIGSQVTALPWQRVNPELAGFIAMKVGSTQIMEILILVLVGAGIFNTLFMSVMERLREFGVLLAIGFSPGRLFGMVMFESLWLSLVGLVLGALVTVGPYLYLNRVGIDLSAMQVDNSEVAGVTIGTVMRVDIYPEHALWIAIAAVLATLAAGLYPAWRAGRVDPVDSIRLG
jgi:ABC-type lipoprotein release transport system permease subunit